jgi:tartrate dehydrogenase/decarboxylase/D-malate dehydrogenase
MFEPVHGSAPDIFGRGIANPLGMIWSGAMLLDWLGETRGQKLILDAIRATTASGLLTPDLGGSARTAEMGDAVAARIRAA